MSPTYRKKISNFTEGSEPVNVKMSSFLLSCHIINNWVCWCRQTAQNAWKGSVFLREQPPPCSTAHAMGSVWPSSLCCHSPSSPGCSSSVWAPRDALGRSFATCSWAGAPDAELQELSQQHCPAPSLGREGPFPERAWTPVRCCSRNVLGAGGWGCTQSPGAAPACGDRAVSLPKDWLEMNCGDGDQSRESWWERAFIEFIIAKSIFVANFHLSCGWRLQTPLRDSHQASWCPYLLHTAHCILPIHCVSRCTRSPVAFLARFCFQQYSLQGWCIHNEFHNSGRGITAPGSAGKERLLQHTVLGEPTGWDSTAGNAGSGKNP